MWGLLQWLADHVIAWRRGRRDVRVRVHTAAFVGSDMPHCFINILNASPQRSITVTHIWLETTPPLPVLVRPLPVTIAPLQQWETWIPVSSVAAPFDEGHQLVRVALADDTLLRAERRRNVPPVGPVPGS